MRNTIIWTVPSEPASRDSGKTYKITEMSAVQAEKWAIRVLMLVTRSGLDIGQLNGGGVEALIVLGLGALAQVTDWQAAEVLLDEMMTCVVILPDKAHPEVERPLGAEGDIEEVTTRFQLRRKILELHTSFFATGGR